jgi:hypothetical protein
MKGEYHTVSLFSGLRELRLPWAVYTALRGPPALVLGSRPAMPRITICVGLGSYRKAYTGGRLDNSVVERLALAVDFLDSNSESILLGGAIKIVTNRTLLTMALPKSSSGGTEPRNEAPLAVYLNTYKVANGEFSVSTTSLKDMSRLARVVVIPIAIGKENEDYLCPGQPLLNMLACGTWAEAAQELKYRASLDSSIESSEKKK